MATDRLALAHVLEGAGIEREGAERVAGAILDAIHDNVATKADIAAVRTDLAAVRTESKADLAAVRTELKADLAAVRTELKADIAAVRVDLAAVRTELKADLAELRTGMVELEHRITLRGISALVVAVGIILAAFRFLGHG